MQIYNITSFQSKIYDYTKLIPLGKVTTYKLIAEVIGSKAYQAVGQALSKNPFSPKVPCHRVICSDLTLGGFYGNKKNIYKKYLLESEGVKFCGNKLKDTSYLFNFE